MACAFAHFFRIFAYFFFSKKRSTHKQIYNAKKKKKTATDIGVIVEWWDYESESNHGEIESVNTRLLAYTSLSVLLFYRIISSLYFFIKERSFKIALLQFLDVLIYREVLNSHKKYKRKLMDKIVQNQTDNTITNSKDQPNVNPNEVGVDMS